MPADTPDRRIVELHAAGVRAVRFNVARGGATVLADLERFAHRVYDLVGWHAEIYIDAAGLDSELSGRIASLPAVSIDHLGMSAAGLENLLHLVERGVKVKATGFGRIDIDPAEAIRAIMDIDPSALMVGTDLPSTRARRPFRYADFDTIRSARRSLDHLFQMWPFKQSHLKQMTPRFRVPYNEPFEAQKEAGMPMKFFESSNYRPGEELRSWKPDDTEPSIVREHDFHTACTGSSSFDALRRLRSGAELNAEDVRHLAELNSWAVQIWYVPPVFFYQGRIMLDPDVDDLVDALDRQ